MKEENKPAQVAKPAAALPKQEPKKAPAPKPAADPKPATPPAPANKPLGLGKVAQIEAGASPKPEAKPAEATKKPATPKPPKTPKAKPEAKQEAKKPAQAAKPKPEAKPAQRKADGETVEALISRHAREISDYIAKHKGDKPVTTDAGVTLDIGALAGYAALRRKQRAEASYRLDYDPEGEAQYWYTATSGNLVATVCIFGGAALDDQQAYTAVPARFAAAWKRLAKTATK